MENVYKTHFQKLSNLGFFLLHNYLLHNHSESTVRSKKVLRTAAARGFTISLYPAEKQGSAVRHTVAQIPPCAA